MGVGWRRSAAVHIRTVRHSPKQPFGGRLNFESCRKAHSSATPKAGHRHLGVERSAAPDDPSPTETRATASISPWGNGRWRLRALLPLCLLCRHNDWMAYVFCIDRLTLTPGGRSYHFVGGSAPLSERPAGMLRPSDCIPLTES